MSLAREGAPTVGIDADVDGVVVVSRAGERVDDEDEDRIESNRIESRASKRRPTTRRASFVSSLARRRTVGRPDEWTNGRRDDARVFFFEAPVEVVSGALLPRAQRMGTVSWGYEETFRARAVLDIRNRRVSWRASAGVSPGARARRWLV